MDHDSKKQSAPRIIQFPRAGTDTPALSVGEWEKLVSKLADTVPQRQDPQVASLSAFRTSKPTLKVEDERPAAEPIPFSRDTGTKPKKTVRKST